MDRDRYWRLSCHPAIPLAAITILLTILLREKKRQAHETTGRLPLRPRRSRRGAIGKLLHRCGKPFVGESVSFRQRRCGCYGYFVRPRVKRSSKALPFCLFCPIGLVRKPWSLWRPTQPMQMMRYDRRKLHALEMVPT